MICVDDPSFNYRFFDRSFGMKKEAWYPDSPPKLVDGYDIRKMITDHIAFVDLRSQIFDPGSRYRGQFFFAVS